MAKTKGAKKIHWDDVRSDIQRMYVYEGMKLEDVRSRLRTGKNFDASSTRISTTFGLEPWTTASNLQYLPGSDPVWYRPHPEETLRQTIYYIERRNVVGLHTVLDFTIANETTPSLAAYSELSQLQHLCGSSLLHLAVAASSAEVVEALIDAGADINKPAHAFPRYTPLMAAAAHDAISIVELLLKKEASMEPTDATGHGALSVAAQCTQDPRIVELLLENSKEPLDSSRCDRLLALGHALSRRKREYGGPNHAISTRVAWILVTANHPMPEHSKSFLEPWTEHPDWVDLINEDEKKSLVHLIRCGLDLDQPCAPPGVHSGATVAHTLLFHCWKAEMPDYLARHLASNDAIGGRLLRILAESCHWKCFQSDKNVKAMSTFIENGVDKESRGQSWNQKLGPTPVWFWIGSLEKCSTRTKIEEALPSLAVLLEAGAHPNKKIETYPIENLLKQEWVHRFPETAIKVLEKLMSHFPDDMKPHPPWYKKPFFPITKNFEKFKLNVKAMAEFRDNTENRLSANSRNLLFRAAYIMSMKKFLASQFSANKDSRAHGKMLSALDRLDSFGVSRSNFLDDFAYDMLCRVVALESRQTPRPGDWTNASGSALLQPMETDNLSPGQPKIVEGLYQHDQNSIAEHSLHTIDFPFSWIKASDFSKSLSIRTNFRSTELYQLQKEESKATMTSAAALKDLAREMVTTLCNKRDYDSPFIQQHVSPSFCATHLNKPSTTNRAEFITMLSTAMTKMPTFHAEIKDVVAEVDEESGKGKAWVFSRMSGFPDGKVQESVDMLEWQGDVAVRGKDIQMVVEKE
ncbi:hypothetical protein SLS54_007253 [Diplodia seriata]